MSKRIVAMRALADLVVSRAFQRFMFFLFFIFLGIVILFSLIPAQDDIPGANDIFSLLGKLIFGDPSKGDKIAHFVAYASVSATAFWGQVKLLKRISFTLLGLIVLGALLEFAQGTLSGRHTDLLDFVANSAGIIIGVLCASIFVFCCARLSSNKGTVS